MADWNGNGKLGDGDVPESGATCYTVPDAAVLRGGWAREAIEDWLRANAYDVGTALEGPLGSRRQLYVSWR